MSGSKRTLFLLIAFVSLTGFLTGSLSGCAVLQRPQTLPQQMNGRWKLLWSGRGETGDVAVDDTYLDIAPDQISEQISIQGERADCFELNRYAPYTVKGSVVQPQRQERSYSPTCFFGNSVVGLTDPLPFSLELQSDKILTWQQMNGEGTFVQVYKRVE